MTFWTHASRDKEQFGFKNNTKAMADTSVAASFSRNGFVYVKSNFEWLLFVLISLVGSPTTLFQTNRFIFRPLPLFLDFNNWDPPVPRAQCAVP